MTLMLHTFKDNKLLPILIEIISYSLIVANKIWHCLETQVSYATFNLEIHSLYSANLCAKVTIDNYVTAFQFALKVLEIMWHTPSTT
jgi:hypothetical protein